MPVYLLVEVQTDQVVGLLRYRYEGDEPSSSALDPQAGPYVYLSRVGIQVERQGTWLGTVLLQFFMHLVLSEMRRLGLRRVTVWCKCVDETVAFVKKVGAFVEFDTPWSPKWGNEHHLKQVVTLAP